MKHLSDFEIIESVKKGNQNDFSILIDRYKNKAFSMLNRMLKNEMDAEEVLQDCFLKAYRGLNNFKQEAKFSTWLFRIVYNTALTRLSAKSRKINLEMSSIEDHYDLGSENGFNKSEQKHSEELIHKLVDKLPPNYAAVINMFYLNGMSCEEISSVMSTSAANVKVILYRSRNALKEMILRDNLAGELL